VSFVQIIEALLVALPFVGLGALLCAEDGWVAVAVVFVFGGAAAVIFSVGYGLYLMGVT
jgi:hypothetical protein